MIGNKIYQYEGLGPAIEFAESLGWVDNHGNAESGDWDPESVDACEEEVLGYIPARGYEVSGAHD